MGNALTAAVLLLFVMLLVASVKVLGLGAGLGIADFVRIVPATVVTFMGIVLPVAVLVAVVMTYGRAAADNEIDTLRACGVHPLHIVTPGLLFGTLMSLLLLLAMDYGKPYAERATQKARKDVDVAQIVATQLASGEPVQVDEKTLISAGSIDENGNATELRVQFFDSDGRLDQELLSERSRIYVDDRQSLIVLELIDYRSIVGDRVSGTSTITRSLANFEGSLNMRALTTPQLVAWLERNERDGRKRGSHKPVEIAAELHFRMSEAAACLVFVLLGIPVALRQRRNDRLGAFLVAFLLSLFLYYPALKISKSMAENRTLDAPVAAWLAHIVMLCVALFYARRTAAA
jgi:lipopolysaccharide export system permease protein